MDIVVHKNIRVNMRDGVALATDVYLPVGETDLPTILTRTPYNKELFSLVLLIAPDPLRLAQSGYAVVVQDCRGCGGSEGEFNPFFQEGTDGLDTLDWITQQPWSNGTVGMAGGSYLGAGQWLTASYAPPSLKTFAPYITTDQYYAPWTYQGGAFQLGFCPFWALGSFALPELHKRLARRQAGLAELGAAMQALGEIYELYQHRPLTEIPLLQKLTPFYFDWLAHPSLDDYWQLITPAPLYSKINVPTLNIGGWYDPFLAGTLASYEGLKQAGGNDLARRAGLVIGPWSHGTWNGTFPEQDFGRLASTDTFDLTGLQLRWFDYWLKSEENGVSEEPAVKIFVMSLNSWREEEDWPLPDTEYTRYYLHSNGYANSRNGDGILSLEEPSQLPPDTYQYDPQNPTPTCGGGTLLPGATSAVNAGPRDQREIELRPDVLVYTTPPLESDIEVTGPVKLILYMSSSVRDTDFTGKLVDVYPDGRAMLLTDGILRTRYRHSFSKIELLEAGEVYELTIDLVATSNLFKAGHSIRLEVSSSNFPRFDRNTNTGGIIAEEADSDSIVATNQIYHDSSHPSHLLLPIINRD